MDPVWWSHWSLLDHEFDDRHAAAVSLVQDLAPARAERCGTIESTAWDFVLVSLFVRMDHKLDSPDEGSRIESRRCVRVYVHSRSQSTGLVQDVTQGRS